MSEEKSLNSDLVEMGVDEYAQQAPKEAKKEKKPAKK